MRLHIIFLLFFSFIFFSFTAKAQLSEENPFLSIDNKVSKINNIIKGHRNSLENIEIELKKQREILEKINNRLDTLSTSSKKTPLKEEEKNNSLEDQNSKPRSEVKLLNEPLLDLPVSMRPSHSKTLGTIKLEKESEKSIESPPTPNTIEDAISIISKGEHKKAQETLETWTKNNPDSESYDEAMYWLAESLFAQRKFFQAESTFLNLYQNFPESDFASKSLLKIAVIKKIEGNKTKACTMLAKLSGEYPDMSPIIKRRSELEQKELFCQ